MVMYIQRLIEFGIMLLCFTTSFTVSIVLRGEHLRCSGRQLLELVSLCPLFPPTRTIYDRARHPRTTDTIWALKRPNLEGKTSFIILATLTVAEPRPPQL